MIRLQGLAIDAVVNQYDLRQNRRVIIIIIIPRWESKSKKILSLKTGIAWIKMSDFKRLNVQNAFD